MIKKNISGWRKDRLRIKASKCTLNKMEAVLMYHLRKQ
jgi:hypothetical protein